MNLNNLVSPLSSVKRRHEIDNAIAQYHKEKEEKALKEDILESSLKKSQFEKDIRLINEQANADKAKRDSLVEKERIFQENVSNTLSALFGVIVYESLPMDDQFKEIDSENIINKSGYIFKKLYESDSVLITNSPTFRDYAGTVVKAVENKDMLLNKDQIEEVLSIIFSEHKIDLNNTIVNVYDKSAKAIATETEINEFKKDTYDENFIHTNSNYVRENMNPTLFRHINEACIENILESGEAAGMNRNGVLNLALADTLFNFTVLETLNTTKLANFDDEEIRSYVKF